MPAFKKDDLGDIIGVSGTVFCTKTGEASIHVKSLTLLCKSLKVLPEKFHGLVDTDLRYRQRYVDCIVNPEVRDTFRKRSRIIAAVREFLDGRGYLEVDTPVLHTVEIGASARPFRTFHNALGIPMFLRIETELYLKRLLFGGFERVYEGCRIFRTRAWTRPTTRNSRPWKRIRRTRITTKSWRWSSSSTSLWRSRPSARPT